MQENIFRSKENKIEKKLEKIMKLKMKLKKKIVNVITKVYIYIYIKRSAPHTQNKMAKWPLKEKKN